MIDPSATKDDLRGAYNQFLKSPVGADFLGKLMAYELSLLGQAYKESEHQKKAQAIDKASGIYWVRTQLEDLSKPKSTVARPSEHSRGPKRR